MWSTFTVLAEPNRRRILDELREGERSVGELVEVLSMSQPAVSKHLRVLREAQLVETRVDRQHRRYRLRPAPLAEIDAWLEPYRRYWATKLDALEAHLDKMGQLAEPADLTDGEHPGKQHERHQEEP